MKGEKNAEHAPDEFAVVGSTQRSRSTAADVVDRDVGAGP